MLEREQMSAKNLNIKLNLVGFDSDLTDKFTKQIDAINRMNTAQNHLQYHWEIGQNAHQCQVHFVIEPTLPHYLSESKAPILSNQNLVAENLIFCPHPITTFDLIDVLGNIEQVFFIEPFTQNTSDSNEKSNITFWREGVMNTPTNTLENPSIAKQTTNEKKPAAAQNDEDKPVFYTYGSFRKNQTTPQPTAVEPVQGKQSVLAQTSSEPKSNESPKETFILYGSLKNNANQKKTTDIISIEADKPTEDASYATSDSTDHTKLESNSATKTSLIANSPSATQTINQDVWASLSKYQNGMVCLKIPEVYVDYENQIIAAAVSNAGELASILLQANTEPVQVTNNIPQTLKHFSLPAVLWSYGLHTQKCDENSQDLDLENQEWKLKDFPRFGQWETHPTWLFLATLFAQDYHSIYAAQAKGKASHQQIKHFIYAAHLAGLAWQTQALPEIKKQQQQDSLQQVEPEKSSWITRLREKLRTNEHFESSLD